MTILINECAQIEVFLLAPRTLNRKKQKYISSHTCMTTRYIQLCTILCKRLYLNSDCYIHTTPTTSVPLCRVTQLEEEVGSCRSQLQHLQSELAGKEADNVSLYEKIRYLQRYSSNRQGSSGDNLMTVVQVDDAGVAQPQVRDHLLEGLSTPPASPLRQTWHSL